MNTSHRSDHRYRRKIAVYGGLTVLSGGLFVVGMVRNGQGAVDRYNKLLAADEAGANVDDVLNELRTYIYSHMNTEIGGSNGIYPPIQLKNTYDRLVAAEQKRVQEINDGLYTEAQEYCEATGNQGFSGRNRIECQQKYVEEKGAKPREIEKALYGYDFVAPRWSPDLAGFSFLAVVIFGLITLLHVAAYFRTKHFVHLAN